MVRTQIYLTEEEQEALRSLAGQQKTSQSDLIRQAIDRFIAGASDSHRRQLRLRARGIWKDHKGVPNIRQLRKAWRAK